MKYKYKPYDLKRIQDLLETLKAATVPGFGACGGKIDIRFENEVIGQIVYDNDTDAWVYIDGED